MWSGSAFLCAISRRVKKYAHLKITVMRLLYAIFKKFFVLWNKKIDFGKIIDYNRY